MPGATSAAVCLCPCVMCFSFGFEEVRNHQMAAGVDEVDRNEFGEGEAANFAYGPDADAL
ncbi:hypothetical protein ACWD04_09505 [Streptomyces sp. NPDC002911]